MSEQLRLLVAIAALQVAPSALGETTVVAQAITSGSTAQVGSPASSSPSPVLEEAPPLLRAVAENNLDLVTQLVAQGSPVNDRWQGRSPLSLAVGQDNYDMAAFLVKSGARPAYDTGQSVLFTACFMRKCDPRMKPLLIQAFIDQSADDLFAKTGKRSASLRKVPTDDQICDAIFKVVRKPGWAPASLHEAEALIVSARSVWVILTYVAIHNADLNQLRAEAHIIYGAGQAAFVATGLKSQNRQPIYFVVSPAQGNTWQAQVGR